jgi:hypothetical protein
MVMSSRIVFIKCRANDALFFFLSMAVMIAFLYTVDQSLTVIGAIQESNFIFQQQQITKSDLDLDHVYFE